MDTPQGDMKGEFAPQIIFLLSHFSPKNNFKCAKISQKLTISAYKWQIFACFACTFKFLPTYIALAPLALPKNFDAGAITRNQDHDRKIREALPTCSSAVSVADMGSRYATCR